MSGDSSNSSESDIKSIKALLKQLSRDFQSLSHRQLEHEAQLKERDTHFSLMEKELKMVKERDEYSHKSKKSSHASSYMGKDSFGEESLRINEYYQPHPRQTRREGKEKESVKEVKVDLPYFHGKENVKANLYWEMKVEQLFACHMVSEERKVPLATLSFQGNGQTPKTPTKIYECGGV